VDFSKKHIGFLDQIRGIAIIAVFLFHSLDTAYRSSQLPWGNLFRDFGVDKSFLFLLPLTFGWAGVAVFFVVSGFCIHLSFARNPGWRDFAARRFFRIYPPYLLALLLFAFCIPWSRISWSSFGAVQLGNHLALTHNFHPDCFYGINPAFWSIAVEAQLYLIYPLLLFFVSRWGWRRSLICIAALEIGIRAISSTILVAKGGDDGAVPLWFTGLPFAYWFSWSIGAAVAEAYLSGHPVPFAKHSLLAWSAIAMGSCFIKPLAPFSFLFFALLTAAVIAKLLGGERALVRIPLFLSRSLSAIGVWSFSIYLLHQPFLVLARRAAKMFAWPISSDPVVIFLLCLCLWFPIVALSALWYRIFELPSIALGKRLIPYVPNKPLQSRETVAS
jgi:peptidoglycan/LPS O-acetylase OafA/YrhL